MFDSVLLTVDFDRTLTGPDSTIPERNLQAIRWFIANGGTFTMNTGRSVNTFKHYLDVIPVNAPFLLYNGSAEYENGALGNYRIIDLPMWEMIDVLAEAFPELNLEVQGERVHYQINPKPEYLKFYQALGWDYEIVSHGQDLGPFLKLSLFGVVHEYTVGGMFVGTEEEIRRFDELEAFIHSRWGHKAEVFRAAPRIIDVHAKGVSKIRAARDLQARLGKKILVCVGDAENDLTMLEGADYAFCPSDGVVAARFPNVCPCGEGAVADVIYKKIPEILGISLDITE